MKTARTLTNFGLILGCLSFVGTISQSEAGTVQFTSSAQLNLIDNVAAVNFYYNPSGGDGNGGTLVTGPIQGVTIDNLNVVGANGNPFSLPGGRTLTIDLPHTTSGDARAESPTIGGPDGAAATQFATSISYFANGDSGYSMMFALGSGLANRAVDVQIIGGDETWAGTLTASVGGHVVGSLSGDMNAATAELMSFTATTNGSGNLEVDLAGTPGPANLTGGQFAGIAGVLVSVPEPNTMILGLVGLFGLAAVLRRRHGA